MKILKILKKRNKHFLFVICILTIFQLFAIAINQIQKGDQKPIDFKKFLAQQIGKNSFGIWKKIDKDDNTFFKEDKGIGSFVIIGRESQFIKSKFQKGIYGFEINLHEKINIASNLVNFVIRNVKFEPNKNKIVIPKQQSLVRFINSNQAVQGKKCNFQGQFFYEYYNVQKHYFVKFKINSDNCPEFNVELNSNIQTVQIKYLEVFFHVIFSFLFLAIQLYLLYLLDQSLQQNLNLCKQTSEITWLIFAGFQLNMAFEQFLVISFDYPFYSSLLLIGIGQFVIFFTIILRILAIKMRQQIDYWTNEGIQFSLRNYLLKIYILAHVIVLGTFYFSVVYSDKPYFYLLWTLAILPQIIKNWNSQQRFIESNKIMSIFYIVCIMHLIYDKFYKYNFKYLNIKKGFNLQTGVYIITLSFVFLIIQAFQENYSSFFLLPKYFRKNQEYDYFTNFKNLPERNINLENNLSENLDTDNESSVSKETTCIICLVSLKRDMKDEDWEKEIQNEQLLDYIKHKSEQFKLMVTPCQHVYHSSCLLAWMNVKLECPLCKKELPGII